MYDIHFVNLWFADTMLEISRMIRVGYIALFLLIYLDLSLPFVTIFITYRLPKVKGLQISAFTKNPV